MRPSLRFALALVGVASFPLAAQAQEETVRGTLGHDPLAIVSGRTTYEIGNKGPLVDQVRAVAALGRSVEARVRAGAPRWHLLHTDYTVELLSIGGRTTANTALYQGHGSGEIRKLGAESPMSVTDVAVESGAEWFKVSLADGSSGFVPAGFVALGTDKPFVRAIARAVMAPIFAHTSKANDARTFHPDGKYFNGTVRSLAPKAPFAAAAVRLEGSAVLRPSQGAHKAGTPDGVDVLGWTIRLTTPGALIGAEPNPGDENFTFLAWAENIVELPLAPFRSDRFDYFSPRNQYFAMIPYRIAETDRKVLLRVVPEPFTPSDASLATPTNGDARDRKLEAGVSEHKAALRIEAKIEKTLVERVLSGIAALSPFRRTTPAEWIPLARITFDEEIKIDNEAFHYYPDLAGRGIIPTGSINAIRAEVYPASQAARPATTAERKAAEKAAADKKTETKGLTGAVRADNP